MVALRSLVEAYDEEALEAVKSRVPALLNDLFQLMNEVQPFLPASTIKKVLWQQVSSSSSDHGLLWQCLDDHILNLQGHMLNKLKTESSHNLKDA